MSFPISWNFLAHQLKVVCSTMLCTAWITIPVIYIFRDFSVDTCREQFHTNVIKAENAWRIWTPRKTRCVQPVACRSVWTVECVEKVSVSVADFIAGSSFPSLSCHVISIKNNKKIILSTYNTMKLLALLFWGASICGFCWFAGTLFHS